MYKEHNNYTPPVDKNIKIWRYMDLSKLLYILLNRALFFTKACKFEDSWEGAITKLNKEDNSEYCKKHNLSVDTPSFSKKWCEHMKINCWQMNDQESVAMWKLYGGTNYSVAIQSTFNKLVESLNQNKSEEHYVGVVKYTNYENERINDECINYRFLHKRKSFSHEQELRIVLELPHDTKKSISEFGVKSELDINILIEKLIVSPFSPNWFYETLEETLRRLGFNFILCKSEIIKEPFW